MALSEAQLNADLDTIFNDLPLSITIGGTTVTGTRMSLRRDAVLLDEGLKNDYRFSVYVKAASLTALPAIRSTVQIGGISYRILSAVVSDDLLLYRIDLGEEFARL